MIKNSLRGYFALLGSGVQTVINFLTRITEDGQVRITEDGQQRSTE